MTRRCTWIMSLSVGVLCSALASARQGQATDLDGALKQFPGYHVLTLQEREPDLKVFLAQHFPKSNPSVVHADFNGDGNLDYALLLKNDKTGATKLVVFLCSAESECKSTYQADETTYATIVYLRPVSTGSKVSQTEAVPGNTPPVKLHSTGIQVNYFEKAKVVLHWNPKRQKIEEIQTGD